ncbi:MAG: hypothetical protein Q8N09_12040 [Thermodesulfovibrionia bacterium]|nr:hypothetical protein [Thermodesulfovibrionia bacterium]
MAKVKEMSVDDIEQIVEHKLLEIIGDPDSGLQLKKEFKSELQKRLKKSSRRTPHQEVLKRFA